MIVHRRHQAVAHVQRRDLFGRTWSILLVVLVCVVLTSAADTVLPDGDKTATTTGTGTAATATPTDDPGIGGVIGGLTSAIGDATSIVGSVLSPILPSASSTSTSTTTSSQTTISSTSSSSNTTTSTLTPATTSSTSSSTSTSTSTTPTTSATPDEVQQSTYLTTSGGHISTVTATVAVAAPSASITHAPAKSFLQNKPLAGTVFALVGLVGLVILIALSTFAIRRTRRNKLERDAEEFDVAYPDPDGYMGGSGGFSNEKRRVEGNVGAAPQRSPSGRTMNSTGPSVEGSEDGLLGSQHNRSPSDGSSSHNHSGMPMMQQQQLGQPIMRFDNGFAPLPAPGAPRAQGVPGQAQPRGYGYENLQRSYTSAGYQQHPGYGNAPAPPSAVYTPQGQGKNAQGLSVNTGSSIPSPWDSKTSPSPIAPIPPFAFQQQHQQQSSQGSGYSGGIGYGTPPMTHQGVQPPSSPSPTRSASSAGTRVAEPNSRPSDSSATSGGKAQRPLSNIFGAENGDDDAYADYAYAMGPGQQGNAPRGLRVANA